MSKIDIKNLTIKELRDRFKKESIPLYRAGQMFSWVYKKGLTNFQAMSNISKSLKSELSNRYVLSGIRLKDHLKSLDGTEKFLFELLDGNLIESVVIPSGERKTLCLSTQVGCKYGCVFCASGEKGLIRDLATSEILDQVVFAQHKFNSGITNFVFMGMGEPLDNYENVSKAIIIMNSEEALGIGSGRITLSTCGIIPGIEKLKSLRLRVNLSISLHATNDRLRSSLMPINRKYPLSKLIVACKRFTEKTRRRITLEYILIWGKNDLLKDAEGLSSIAKKLKAKVNLLVYSAIPCKDFTPSPEKEIDMFKKVLIRNKVASTIRESKGKVIEAACV